MPKTYQLPCSYFSDRTETIVAIECPWLPNLLHANLMQQGFRHSGSMFYLPVCAKCHACLPLRIPTETFKPTKSQRRVIRKNAETTATFGIPELTPEKCDIYQRYIRSQHPGSPQTGSEQELRHFLYSPIPSLREMVFYREGKPVAVSIVDYIERLAFSSVYHYFDPDYSNLSLGTFSAAFEIQYARQHGIPYYYFGFWIPDCPEMSYKNKFGPNEILWDHKWTPNTPDFMAEIQPFLH